MFWEENIWISECGGIEVISGEAYGSQITQMRQLLHQGISDGTETRLLYEPKCTDTSSS